MIAIASSLLRLWSHSTHQNSKGDWLHWSHSIRELQMKMEMKRGIDFISICICLFKGSFNQCNLQYSKDMHCIHECFLLKEISILASFHNNGHKQLYLMRQFVTSRTHKAFLWWAYFVSPPSKASSGHPKVPNSCWLTSSLVFSLSLLLCPSLLTRPSSLNRALQSSSLLAARQGSAEVPSAAELVSAIEKLVKTKMVSVQLGPFSRKCAGSHTWHYELQALFSLLTLSVSPSFYCFCLD